MKWRNSTVVVEDVIDFAGEVEEKEVGVVDVEVALVALCVSLREREANGNVLPLIISVVFYDVDDDDVEELRPFRSFHSIAFANSTN